MSTAELAPTIEHRPAVTPDSNGVPVHGVPGNGVPAKRGEQLQRRDPQGSYIDVTVGQGQDEARIPVRDRGCGLTAADAGRVFEKYQQAGPDASGGGLDLYVSRGLASAHGGDLDVHPATARGSEFRFTSRTQRRLDGVGDAGVTGVGHVGSMKRKQTGLMVLRVWTEDGSSEPLRVDVRQTYDLSRGFRNTPTLTDVDMVVAAVRKFLETGRAVGAAGGNGAG